MDLENKIKLNLKQEKPNDHSLSNNFEDKLIKSLTEAIVLSRKIEAQEENKRKAIIQQNTETLYDKNKGSAILDFQQRMEQEIADNKFVLFTYFEALAKKFGVNYKFSISGYDLVFKQGQDTRIPLSLYPEVKNRFFTNRNLDREIHFNDEDIAKNSYQDIAYSSTVLENIDKRIRKAMGKRIVD